MYRRRTIALLVAGLLLAGCSSTSDTSTNTTSASGNATTTVKATAVIDENATVDPCATLSKADLEAATHLEVASGPTAGTTQNILQGRPLSGCFWGFGKGKWDLSRQVQDVGRLDPKSGIAAVIAYTGPAGVAAADDVLKAHDKPEHGMAYVDVNDLGDKAFWEIYRGGTGVPFSALYAIKDGKMVRVFLNGTVVQDRSKLQSGADICDSNVKPGCNALGNVIGPDGPGAPLTIALTRKALENL